MSESHINLPAHKKHDVEENISNSHVIARHTVCLGTSVYIKCLGGLPVHGYATGTIGCEYWYESGSSS